MKMDEDHPKIPIDKDRDLEMLEVVKPKSQMWTTMKYLSHFRDATTIQQSNMAMGNTWKYMNIRYKWSCYKFYIMEIWDFPASHF